MCNTMRNLPDSERMVGGPLVCMYNTLEPGVRIRDWCCRGVYMNVPYEVPHPYSGVRCQAVQRAVDKLRCHPDIHTSIAASLFDGVDGAHFPGHPLPGVFTVCDQSFRVDLRVYGKNQKHLWAALYYL